MFRLFVISMLALSLSACSVPDDTSVTVSEASATGAQTAPVAAQTSKVELPAYAQAQKDRLAALFATAENYNPAFRTQVNSREEKLQSVDLVKGVGEIDGEQRIEVPAELIPLWSYFRQLQLVGDTSRLAAHWEGSDGSNAPLSFWYRTDTLNVFQADSLPARPSVGYTLIVKGEGRLDAIRLQISDEGISRVFDESPWSVLAADKPVLPVKLDIDLESNLSVGGVTEFERDKYFRVYASAWGGPWGVHDHFLDHGFTPGRQIFKIGPALEFGYDDEYPNKPAFVEDPDRPRHADPTFFGSGWRWPQTIPDGIAERYQDLDFVLCFDDWPTFNRHSGEGVVNSRGTPVDFVAAAETAGRSLDFIRRQTGVAPKWLEVKNESDISYEWSYHNAPGEDGWAKLAEFHNEMARGVKRFVPEVLVGGPTTAYPNFAGGDDWQIARNHMQFMDRTKGQLDFYSHHFYEGDELLFEDGLREGRGSYLLGRMTAYLDLIRNHQAQTDNLVPLLITEYGSLSGGGEDHQVWKKLRNYSAYMVQYMQRPDEIDIAVPFIIPFVWWEPEAKDGIFVFETIDEKRDLNKLTANRPGIASGISGSPMTGIYPSKASWFLDLWQGYQGQLIPVSSDTPNVNVHAAVDGNTVWLAVSNVKSRRLSVDLRGAIGGRKVKAAEQRRLFLDSGELQFSIDDVTSQLDAIRLAAEETSVLKLTLAAPVQPQRSLTQTRHYGSRTLMPTGEPQPLTIAAPTVAQAQGVVSAKLRVAVQRPDGFTSPLKIDFNGHALEVDLSDSRGIAVFDTVKEIEVPADLIQAENQVTLTQPDRGGMLATAVLFLTAER